MSAHTARGAEQPRDRRGFPLNAPAWQARMYIASKNACRLPSDPKLAFCYDILNSVSRRWASVHCRGRAALLPRPAHARKPITRCTALVPRCMRCLNCSAQQG